MPSTSSGQNVDAASANTSATASANSIRMMICETSSGTSPPTIVATHPDTRERPGR